MFFANDKTTNYPCILFPHNYAFTQRFDSYTFTKKMVSFWREFHLNYDDGRFVLNVNPSEIKSTVKVLNETFPKAADICGAVAYSCITNLHLVFLLGQPRSITLHRGRCCIHRIHNTCIILRSDGRNMESSVLIHTHLLSSSPRLPTHSFRSLPLPHAPSQTPCYHFGVRLRMRISFFSAVA